jgi:hypothetical protein
MRTLVHAKLLIGKGLVSIDCVVRNRSIGGAEVRLLEPSDLPPTLGLMLITEGLLFDAKVSWRRGDKVGLLFTGHHNLRGDVDRSLSAVRVMWAKLAQRS